MENLEQLKGKYDVNLNNLDNDVAYINRKFKNEAYSNIYGYLTRTCSLVYAQALVEYYTGVNLLYTSADTCYNVLIKYHVETTAVENN